MSHIEALKEIEQQERDKSFRSDFDGGRKIQALSHAIKCCEIVERLPTPRRFLER